MKIVVVGSGRMGMALARSARSAGHEVTLLGRAGSRSAELARVEGFSVLTDAACAGWNDIDLVLLAVATENPETDVLALRNSLAGVACRSAGIPLASVVGSIDLRALARVFDDRPIARFFCSAAVDNPSAIRFYDENSSSKAVALLKEALPSDGWRAMPSESFERYGTLLVAAALACVPLLELADALGPLAPEENEFLISTLDEARRLIEAHALDPAAAFASALTPGGMTQSFAKQMFRREEVEKGDATDNPRNSA